MSSAVSNLWRQLVQRRLLPVAILLIAALAAVPLLLAKDADPVPVPPPAQVDTKSELATTPIVTAATAGERIKRRKVLGAAKNPFAVDVEPAEAETPAGGDAGGTTPDAPKPDAGSGGAAPGAGSPPSSGAPVAPTAPTVPDEPAPAPKKYAPEELTVRFGGSDDDKRESVKRLQPLPSAELPVLIYMGVLKDGKTAEFMLDAGVTAIGDGECHPSPDECETIRLRVGETEFLDVVDESGNVAQQFQLDLLKIHNVKQRDSAAARTKSVKAKSAVRRTKLRSVASAIVAATRLP